MIHYIGWIHIGWLRALAIVISLSGAVVIASDASVKVALIVAIPSTLVGIGTLILGFLNRADTQRSLAHQVILKTDMDEVKKHTNGMLTQLTNEKSAMRERLIDKSQELAHAEGMQQERTEERDRNTDTSKRGTDDL